MRKWIYGTAALLALTALPAFGQDAPITTISTPPNSTMIQLTPVVDSLRRPLFITAAPSSDALYILEQGGIIKRVGPEGGEPEIYLDVSGLVTASANGSGYSEQGLLGLAFRPDFAEIGVLFINYTDQRGNTVIARYIGDDEAADPSTAQIIFTQEQPFANHNGGHMAFGADGYLYVALGDGGSADDPQKNGQNLQTLLGKILRLDVSSDEGYTIPADNPFINGGGLPEIWAYGVRNPWRFSFDKATGDLYIGDVGQNVWEEVDFQPADSKGGENYGWPGYEATHEHEAAQIAENTIMPIAEYKHNGPNGCSISGGYVYRGSALPALQGVYFYGDYCTGRIWMAYRNESNEWKSDIFMNTGYQISSFGEDNNGELYVIDYSGEIYRIDPKA